MHSQSDSVMLTSAHLGMTVTPIGCTISMLTENILSTSTTPLLVVLKVTQDEGEELLRVSILDDGLLKSVLSKKIKNK